MKELTAQDFPLRAIGQYVYVNSQSSPIIGPVEPSLAEDLARRLNRDAAKQATAEVRQGSLAEFADYIKRRSI